MRTLQDNFVDIATRASNQIQGNNINAQTFRLQFTIRMDVSQRYEYQPFLECYLMTLEPGVTTEDLLCRLSMYWDFLNYGLLEHTINIFGDASLKQDMIAYIHKLRAFRVITRLCDFIDNWPVRGQVPPNFSNLVIKMEREWEECTLEDIEMFRETLTHKFFLPNFAQLLREAERGCICLTWYIPASSARTIQENLPTIETEFFKTHGIQRVSVNGQECFLTPVRKFATYLKGVYKSEAIPTILSFPPANKPLPFNLAQLNRIKVSPSDKFTRTSIRGDMDDIVCQKKPMDVCEVGVLPDGSQPKLVLIEGAPGVGKTAFSWDFCTKWGIGEALQEYSVVFLLPLRDNRLKEATGLSDLFYHPDPHIQKAVLQEVESTRGKGVLIWLEAFDELDEEKRTQPSIFLDLICGRVLPDCTIFLTSRPWATASIAEKCKDRISQHIEILASADLQIKQYMEKSNLDPSSAAKFSDYLSSNPAVKALMYTPVTVNMVVKTYNESPPPTTMTKLYTTFTHTLLLKYLSSHPLYSGKQWKLVTFSDLPDDVRKDFMKLCEVACSGILNGNQLVFPADQVDFDHLGLMQETPQLYIKEGSPSSFNVLHLTLQEYLAAVHISHLPTKEQTELIKEHLKQSHFKIVFRFLAGLTPEVVKQLVSDDKLALYHLLFESHNDLTTVSVLGSRGVYLYSERSWTPLDFYVTGYCIAHSECYWSLRFWSCSIDDEKLDLFSKGCYTSACSGYISDVDFSDNSITSDGIQKLLRIPQHIRQDMYDLSLERNELDARACDLLAKAAPTTWNLRCLDLSNNPSIGKGGAVELIKVLKSSALTSLALEMTGIGEEDCVSLSTSFSYNLQLLNIGHNNLSSKSVETIIKGISTSSLRVLVMSHSQFSMAAVEDLTSVLSGSSKCTLTWLMLDNCNISTQGVVAIAASICKNSTLRVLCMDHNPIGQEGAAAIAEMLTQNKALEELYLYDDSVGEKGARQLISSLSQNSTLEELVLLEKYNYTCHDNPRVHHSQLRLRMKLRHLKWHFY